MTPTVSIILYEDALAQRDHRKAIAEAQNEALKEYGNHLAGCKIFKKPFKCNCGYDAALAAYDAAAHCDD